MSLVVLYAVANALYRAAAESLSYTASALTEEVDFVATSAASLSWASAELPELAPSLLLAAEAGSVRNHQGDGILAASSDHVLFRRLGFLDFFFDRIIRCHRQRDTEG